jgi:uncharacterized protein YeaO (DUF488 family)
MGEAAATFGIKRIYEAPADDDGCRVLVDRLWPRGLSKENARLDLWLKKIAPSPPLRKEFGHMKSASRTSDSCTCRSSTTTLPLTRFMSCG